MHEIRSWRFAAIRPPAIRPPGLQGLARCKSDLTAPAGASRARFLNILPCHTFGHLQPRQLRPRNGAPLACIGLVPPHPSNRESSMLFFSRRRRRRSPVSKQRRPACHLALEPLESRVAPAIFNVNTTADTVAANLVTGE